MNQKKVIDFITEQDWLDTTGDAVQPAIIKAFKAGGKTGNSIKNFLHGTWLGHPLHPVITDVPIGAWTAAAVLDGLELCGEKKYTPGADAAIAVGLVGAVGSVVDGPATEPQPKFEVRVNNGQIEVRLQKAGNK